MAGKKPKKKASSGSKQFESSLRKDILIIVLFAVCLFLFLCCFGIGGIVGEFISGILFGLFGLVSYILPWFLFVGLLVLISNQADKLSIIKFVSGSFFTIFLSAFVWLVTPDFDDGAQVTDYFAISKDARAFGGFFGGAIAKFFSTFMGRIGAFIIVVLILVITAVIIIENSFLRKNKKPGESIFASARIGAEHAREKHHIHREKRELSRAEHRLRKEEEWEQERLRKEDELARRREALAASRNNVTFDTKLVPPEELARSAPKAAEEPAEEPAAGTAKRKEIPRVMTLEESIASQNVTEIIIPGLENMPEPVLPEPEITVAEDTVPPVPEEILPPPEFRIIEKETPPPAHNPEDVVRPVFEEPLVMETSMQEIVFNETEEPAVEEVHVEEPVVEETAVEEPAGDESAVEEPAKEKPKTAEYKFPPTSLLKKGTAGGGDSKSQLDETANLLVSTLQSFGVTVKLLDVSCGPTVTRYELEPDTGVKVSKILSLADDIKLKLAAPDIRIEAPIPGKAAIGIEVPNKHNVSVMLRDLLESKEFTESSSKLTFAVGKDIGGNVIVSDIAKMPHLLIAGATGSGKSVCLNTLIMSILYKAKPDEVKLIMIDPKVVELSIYNGIPHLMIPVVTDPKKASGALNWAVGEMTNRYKSFADFNVRDIKGYNQKMAEMRNSPEYDEVLHAPLPQILIAVDELADMMMVAPREVEDSICRLAQLARAAGIHLIIATQRPSVDVITGLIKANMPSRLALAVSSGVDSRTIIDMNGAEKLLGNGDMLFYPQGYQKPLRVQGAYISDSEVGAVADFLKKQAKGEEYNKEIEEQILSSGGMSGSGGSDDKDELFVEAAQLIIENDKASIGMLQRKLRIGFNRAARIMDQLSDAGVVGPEEGTKPRTVLMSMEQFEQYIEESF